jgi:hypothetical protein
MEARFFDEIARSLVETTSRRGVLARTIAGLFGGALASAGATTGAGACTKARRPCAASRECCDDLACKKIRDCGLNGDRCCGRAGAACDGICRCCGLLECIGGVCTPV